MTPNDVRKLNFPNWINISASTFFQKATHEMPEVIKSIEIEAQKQSDYQTIKLLITKTSQLKNCATEYQNATESKLGTMVIFVLSIERLKDYC